MATCYAVGCPGIANPAWDPSRCNRWGPANIFPKGLIDFLRTVYDRGRAQRIANADEIYTFLYAPGSNTGNQFPTIGPDAQTAMRYLNNQMYQSNPFKKIYLNIHPQFIRFVFDKLIVEAPRFGNGLHSMKRNTEAGAAVRAESIVIYTMDQQTTDRIIGMISRWLTVAPYQLRPDFFRPALPPSAMAVHPGGRNLPGVGVATERSTRTSHGSQISSVIFTSVNYVQTQWPNGFNSLTFPQFICGTIDFIRAAGIDPRRPWNLTAGFDANDPFRQI